MAAVLLLAVLGGLAALVDDAAPTGLGGVDGFWRFATGALVVGCAGFATPVAWVLSAGFAAVSSAQPLLIVVGLIGLVIAGFGVTRLPDRPEIGSAVALCAVWVAFRLPHDQVLGMSTLIGVIIVAPVLVVGWYYGPYGFSRVLSVLAWLGVAVALAAGAVMVITAVRVRSDMNAATDAADQALTAFRNGDEDLARALLDDALVEMRAADDATNPIWVRATRYVPVVSQHTRTLSAVADQAIATGEAALSVVDAIDRDALAIDGGAIDLRAVVDMRPSLRSLAAASATAQVELEAVRSPWLVGPLEDGLDDALGQLVDVVDSSSKAVTAAELSPDMLGLTETRNLLVLFATPAEARGSVGLVGNWAHLTATDGALALAGVGRASDIEEGLGPTPIQLDGPASYLDRYGNDAAAGSFPDVTLSPDFPDVALVAAQMFERARDIPIDTVVLVDPDTMVGILGITGPQNVLGTRIDAQNVRDFLLLQQYAEFDTNEQRIAFLALLLEQTFSDLVSGEFPDPWDLDDVFGPAVASDRLVVAAVRPDEQQLLEDLGIAGDFAPQPGDDLVSVIAQNAGQNKIDTFLSREIAYDVAVDAITGEVRSTLTVTLTNAVPEGDFPLAVIGNNDQGFPLGTSVIELVVYSPHTLSEALVDGEPQGFAGFEEFGVRGYSRVLELPRGATTVVQFDLAGQVDVGDGYRLQILGQPLVQPDRIDVSVTSGRNVLLNGATGPWSLARLTSEDITAEVTFSASN